MCVTWGLTCGRNIAILAPPTCPNCYRACPLRRQEAPVPTGPKHQRFVFVELDEGGRESGYCEDCRCMIGEDHDGDDGGSEALSVHEAADIWLSNGMDEDYTFGYSDSKLRAAAGLS